MRKKVLGFLVACSFGFFQNVQAMSDSFDQKQLLIRHLNEEIKHLESQAKQIIDQIVSSSSPSVARKVLINWPTTILKQCIYILGSAAMGAGILLVVNDEGLQKIRDTLVNDRGNNVRQSAEIKAAATPQFIGKSILSFIGSYIVLLIIFEYLLASKLSDDDREVLQSLAIVLQQHAYKLKELKMALS